MMNANCPTWGLIGLLATATLSGVVMGPEYTVTATDALVETLAESPFARPTASGDASFIVNTTPGSIAGGYGLPDPQIPPLPQYGIHLTDHTVTGEKIRIVVIGGTHAREQSGSHLLDGFLRKLIDGSPEMVQLLRHAELYVYPQVNPEGRYGYNQPGNPHGLERDAPSNLGVGAFDEDLNRIWNEPADWPQIAAIQSVIRFDTDRQADIFFDFHARSFSRAELAAKRPSEGPKQVWVPEVSMDSRYLRFLEDYEPTVEYQTSSGARPGRMTGSQWGRSALGVNAPDSFTPEVARDEPPQFYQDFGTSFALALADYVRLVAPESDYDGDGVQNCIETLFGTDRETQDAQNGHSVRIENNLLCLTWRQSLGASGFRLVPQTSSTGIASDWTEVESSSIHLLDTFETYEVYEISWPLETSRRFVRFGKAPLP